MRQEIKLFVPLGGHLLLVCLIVGMIATWSVPIHAATVTITIDCEKGTMTTKDGVEEPVPPGACPPPLSWQPGPPPNGAIQVNPTGPLPPGASCATGMAHNRCSRQGFACDPGKTCKDTWNSVTNACMCKCM